MSGSLPGLAADACRELAAVFDQATDDTFAPFIEELRRARRIALYGVGREGLMMKALAMRLFHMGLDAHVVGDMSTPPVGPGDLLVVSAGPGRFSTVLGLIGVAREAGARVACVTAQPSGAAPRAADVVLHLPAQTMADDAGPAPASILPMGSLFEGVQYVAFEVIVLRLRDLLEVAPEDMRRRHTNLE